MMRVATLILLLSLFISCKKYEEGPGLSLRTKKSRLEGKWKIEFVDFNGDDITNAVIANFGSNYFLQIKKDETYYKSGSNIEDVGTWKFGHEKSYIIMLSNISGSQEIHYEILKLKNDALWIKHTHDTHITELHYKK